MNAHTPGPWISVKSKAHTANPDCLRVDVHSLGAVFSPAYVAGDILPADAHLIAAAPDLLAALERIIPWARKGLVEGIHKNCVAPNDLDGAINQARAAVSKSRGQS